MARISARVPRYTSYPTAAQFHAGVGAREYRAWLAEIPAGAPLSLYVHIPFCVALCWFCACHTNVANTYRPVAGYLEDLFREIDLVSAILGPGRLVSDIHWGGGSPTILSPEDIGRLAAKIRASFQLAEHVEFAAEIDPRGASEERATALGAAGLSRASLGVQELDPLVQQAINRRQPLAAVEQAFARLRGAGVRAFNADLMYGLPHQRVSHIQATAAAVAGLGADRIAVFGFAHVPAFKRHQLQIDAAALPTVEERLAQYEAAHAAFIGLGYQPIGLDHFARPDDPLAIAQRTGRLKRSFQGYGEGAASVIGLGASAISTLPQGYAQNASAVASYRSALAGRALATQRGITLSDDDRLRAAIIERLMCDLAVDVGAVCAPFGRAPEQLGEAWRALDELAREGLCAIEGTRVSVPHEARHGVRLVAAAFDRHLAPSAGRHALAV